MSCKGDGEAAVSGLENHQETWGPWKLSEKLVENIHFQNQLLEFLVRT